MKLSSHLFAVILPIHSAGVVSLHLMLIPKLSGRLAPVQFLSLKAMGFASFGLAEAYSEAATRGAHHEYSQIRQTRSAFTAFNDL
jgi:hypothetical protein